MGVYVRLVGLHLNKQVHLQLHVHLSKQALRAMRARPSFEGRIHVLTSIVATCNSLQDGSLISLTALNEIIDLVKLFELSGHTNNRFASKGQQ